MSTTSPTVEVAVSDLLKAVGAWRIGHFLLTSGLHSDQYMQCQRVLQYPQFGNFLADLIVDKLIENNIKPDTIIGPALGAVHWELFVAGAFGRRYAKQQNGDYFLSLENVQTASKPENVQHMAK